MKKEIVFFWFRRDLRLKDNQGLFQALQSGYPVCPVFIFDTEILDSLPRKDVRVDFIHDTLIEIKQELKGFGSDLVVKVGESVQVWKDLINEFNVTAVFTNHDYEPYALDRDEKVRNLLESNGVTLRTFKDQVIFETDEVLKDDGKPYTVFTPYSRKWKNRLQSSPVQIAPSEELFDSFYEFQVDVFPDLLEDLGFERSDLSAPPIDVNLDKLSLYDKQRDFPAIPGTSHLGIHLRFGTIGIRTLWLASENTNPVFLNQLIWRDFYAMILVHFPHVATGAFRPDYDRIAWINNESQFKAWCVGQTGYPMVDAGMRELNATGYMHNRVRMVTASFLAKHLLIDWRWGEAYFAEKLLDFDLAANNGSWQWAAGCGCDAAPYFRVFNPELQAKKFDPKLEYIRKWVPEFQSLEYAQPIVEHKMARVRAIETYKAALKG